MKLAVILLSVSQLMTCGLFGLHVIWWHNPRRTAMRRTRRVSERAWELHKEHGHPKGYDGPCWGPTHEEWLQAEQEAESGT